MPRPFAITRERREKVLAALRAGALYRDACEAAGIPWSTWTDWSRRVREGTCDDDDVVALVADARAAYAQTNVGLKATVAKAATKDWRAAAWLAEHRGGDPKARADARRARYEADIAKHRAEGTHVDTVRHVGELSDDELDRRIAELEAATKH